MTNPTPPNPNTQPTTDETKLLLGYNDMKHVIFFSLFCFFGMVKLANATEIYCNILTASNLTEGWSSEGKGSFSVDFDDWKVQNTNLLCTKVSVNLVNPENITFECSLNEKTKTLISINRVSGKFRQSQTHDDGPYWVFEGQCEKSIVKF